MDQRTLDVLEYSRLREEMSGFCMSEEGKAAFLSLVPLGDLDEVRRLKTLGQAWMRSLSAEQPPRFVAWPAVSPFLERLRVEGASLQAGEFFALGQFCASVGQFREWAALRDRQKDSGRRDALSMTAGGATADADARLVSAVLELPDLAECETEIFRVIDRSTGEVRDLPELRAIRQGIRKIRQDIDRLVGAYLSDDVLKSALQSNLPTIRDGRLVIAVRVNYKNRVKGIVHEVSQSGQTAYIEPDDVVDRNNDLVSEESRLAREIARILRELTVRIASWHGTILSALGTMTFFDGIGASARWGNDYRCVYTLDEAEDGSKTILKLKQARHPLLRTKAVPIDLALVPGGRVLIITGPNTGGKTVTLKTAALLSLFNQTGWPVPAAEGTVLPVFDQVFCDIGDEQSLDQSLSTFSGHMKNIAGILSRVTERSLVLLDELGSGTDPQEGSAIAMAVLDRLLESNPIVMVTTHHGILKNYGYTHESCVNASVDFDQDTLSPTYRILMGVPGESHALDVAARNGLDVAVVAQARTYLREERADVSALIKGLTAKHEELAEFETEKRKEEQSLREKRRKADLRELQLRQKEVELREQGYRRLENLFADSRKQLENLVREIREGELTREKTLQVKAWISEFGERVAAEYDGLVAARDDTEKLGRDVHETRALEDAESGAKEAAASKGRGRSVRRGEGAKPIPPTAVTVPEFAPGVDVYIGPSRQRGVLVREEKKGRWIVAAGPVRMTVDADKISAVPQSGSPRKVSVEVETVMGGDDVPAFELRLLGMRHDEAMKALERQLDLASMKGLREFSIVHGKGHGILQSAVHQLLGTYAAVSEYHFARPEDGGTGKTIVRLS